MFSANGELHLKQIQMTENKIDNLIVDGRTLYGQVRHKIQDEAKTYLLHNRKLKEWMYYTLAERCDRIRTELGSEITATTLSKFYRKNPITKTKPDSRLVA